jgi:thiamine biosynthesis protein ThiS
MQPYGASRGTKPNRIQPRRRETAAQLMKLQINGEERTFDPAVPTVAALVETLGMKSDRVAIELNRDIIPRGRWTDTNLHEGDKLEVVHFVGGGSPPA